MKEPPMPKAPITNNDPLLSKQQLADFIGVSAASIDRLRASGEAPAATQIGARNFWRMSGVQAWLDERTEARAK
jgi:predicted DNA-binding transcriptional regulator AlpA